MNNRKIIKDLLKKDFGSYQGVVEGFVFEIEKNKQNLNKLLRKERQHILGRFITVLTVLISTTVCPIILIIMAYLSNKGVLIEYCFYLAWTVIGLNFSMKPIKNLQLVRKDFKIKENNLTSTWLWSVKYAQVVSDAFFNKNKEIENIFLELRPEDITEITDGFWELNIDLSRFEDITYGADRCNNEPVLLVKDYYQDGRDFAKQYLNEYYFKLIQEY